MNRMRRVTKKLGFDYKKLDRRRGNLFNKVIFIQVTGEVHALVKERAIERNISIRQWITRAIIRGLKEEFRSLR